MGEEMFVGIDLGGEVHQVAVVDAQGQLVAERRCSHQGGELRRLVDWVLEQAGRSERVAVALESPRGGVAAAFLSAGVAVYSINPKQLERFRDRFSASGSKDDRKDALVAADALRTDRRHFTRVEADDPAQTELRELTRLRRGLVAQHGRVANQLRAVLHDYWPELLTLSPAANEPWLWALLEKVSRPDRARKVRTKTWERLLKGHRIRRFDAQTLRALLEQPEIPVSEATLRACQHKVAILVRQLRLLHDQIKQTERLIDDGLQQLVATESERGGAHRHGIAEIVLSFPGAGRLVAATLVGEAYRQLEDYQRMRCLAGTAPVTRASGKRLVVHRRWSCHKQLRDAMTYWAANAVNNDPHLNAKYSQIRDRGHGYHRALRQIGDRLLRMLAAAIATGETYRKPGARDDEKAA